LFGLGHQISIAGKTKYSAFEMFPDFEFGNFFCLGEFGVLFLICTGRHTSVEITAVQNTDYSSIYSGTT
jgi:hypothetical protein